MPPPTLSHSSGSNLAAVKFETAASLSAELLKLRSPNRFHYCKAPPEYGHPAARPVKFGKVITRAAHSTRGQKRKGAEVKHVLGIAQPCSGVFGCGLAHIATLPSSMDKISNVFVQNQVLADKTPASHFNLR